MLKVTTSFFLIPAIFSQSTTAGYCCQKITVSDVASELNGVYIFKRIGLETLESVHYIRLGKNLYQCHLKNGQKLPLSPLEPPYIE